MEFVPNIVKMKCACCRKTIRIGQIFMITTSNDEEKTSQHLCYFCYEYAITLKKQTLINACCDRLVKNNS